MAVKADELYSNLNKLLDDICKFLTDKGNYEKLSYQARSQADELIKRSKKQLQEIAKINIEDDEYGAYVDMERKPGENNEDEKNNIYSSVDETPESPQINDKPLENPYTNLPARSLSQDCKYGALSWKCKFLLKFEKVRRIYAGVHHNWFLVYSSEKDSKPMQSFDLKFHKAKLVPAKQNKNPPQDFELVSLLEGKSYYFLALTYKDMQQWISHINRCHDSVNNSENLSASEESASETYDMIAEANKEEEEEEEEDIYHDIEAYAPQKPEIVDNKPPDLPARRCINRITPLLPTPLPRNDKTSKESLQTNGSQESRISLESASSFSEDDEDNIYEAFVSQPVQVKSSVIGFRSSPRFLGRNPNRP